MSPQINYAYGLKDIIIITAGNNDSSKVKAEVIFQKADGKLNQEINESGNNKDIKTIMDYHPNWTFEFYDAGISLNDFVEKEWSQNSPTPKTDIGTFKETDQNIINERQRYGVTDGPSFYLSNRSGVEFFSNPLHFLNDGSVGYGTSDGLFYDDDGIYQFMQLGFDSSYQTVDGVKSMIQGTYFDSDIDNYAKWFFEASK